MIVMDWAELNKQLQANLLKLPQPRIIQFLLVALVVYIAFLGAQVTWMLLPVQNFSSNPKYIAKPVSASSAVRVDINALKTLNLFGKATEKTAKKEIKPLVVEDAPPTRLNLTLSGVAASNDDSVAAAIIENAGKQETYGVGEKIEGTRAVLRKVMPDRVLIEQSGKLETLMLDGFTYQKMSAISASSDEANSGKRLESVPAQGVGAERAATADRKNITDDQASKERVDQRNNQAVRERVAELKQKIATDPGKITDYIKISPKRAEGKTVGYRLMPGKDKAFFTESGLKAGDVAVQINGKDLSDPKAAGQAMMELRQAEDIVLLIDRNGSLTEILFSLRK
jgi:general secretion pathway protein C